MRKVTINDYLKYLFSCLDNVKNVDANKYNFQKVNEKNINDDANKNSNQYLQFFCMSDDDFKTTFKMQDESNFFIYNSVLEQAKQFILKKYPLYKIEENSKCLNSKKDNKKIIFRTNFTNHSKQLIINCFCVTVNNNELNIYHLIPKLYKDTFFFKDKRKQTEFLKINDYWSKILFYKAHLLNYIFKTILDIKNPIIKHNIVFLNNYKNTLPKKNKIEFYIVNDFYNYKYLSFMKSKKNIVFENNNEISKNILEILNLINDKKIDIKYYFNKKCINSTTKKKCDYYNDCKQIYFKKESDFFKYSGTILKKNFYKNSSFLEVQNKVKKYRLNFDDLFLSKSKQYFYQNKMCVDKDSLLPFLTKIKSNIVFFDIETISIPLPIFDLWYPYCPCVVQYSYIKLKDNKKIDQKNFIIDNDYNSNFLIDYINNIYQKNSSYVVYSNYESYSLKTILNYFDLSKNSCDTKYKKIYEECIKKIIEIRENIVDLCEPFKFVNDKILVYIPELYFFYSIKCVNSYLIKNYPEICKLTNLLSYKKLKIKNGQEASQILLNIALKKYKIDEYNEIIYHLKKYCAIDVAGLWAILLFLQKIAN